MCAHTQHKSINKPRPGKNSDFSYDGRKKKKQPGNKRREEAEEESEEGLLVISDSLESELMRF